MVGRPDAGTAPCLALQDHEPSAAIRQGQQGLRQNGFVLLAVSQIKPTLDFNVRCFSRIKQQIGEPTTVWRRNGDAHESPMSHPLLDNALL